MNNAILIGYSGHSYVVADAYLKGGGVLKYYLEKSEAVINPFNIEYLGKEEAPKIPIYGSSNIFLLGIGDNQIRKKVGNFLLEKGEDLNIVIHPGSVISSYAELDQGVFVNASATVNAYSKIGIGTIINSSAVVEHECKIGDYVHVAPGAVLAGNVNVGNNTFIGANSVIKEGIQIGEDVIIGAGSTVIRDVKKGAKIVGNPARLI